MKYLIKQHSKKYYIILKNIRLNNNINLIFSKKFFTWNP